MLSEALNLLRIVLTIPVTSATVEHTFSSIRMLKSYLRSFTTQSFLIINIMMLLHVHKDKTDLTFSLQKKKKNPAQAYNTCR